VFLNGSQLNFKLCLSWKYKYNGQRDQYVDIYANNFSFVAVVVQAHKNTPALDLDSILFLDHGRRPLGQIFDVFGPVTEPLYCVRFNSAEHIKEKGIEKDMAVYCAPKTQHTSYVFVPDLLR